MPEMVHKAVTDAWDAHEGINEAALEKVLEEIFARNFERYVHVGHRGTCSNIDQL